MINGPSYFHNGWCLSAERLNSSAIGNNVRTAASLVNGGVVVVVGGGGVLEWELDCVVAVGRVAVAVAANDVVVVSIDALELATP